MKPLEEQTFYELLDVPADASAEQIEQAFAKAMAFYGPESLATYSLAGGEESKYLLERIEEAYLTLSDSGLRGDYDRLLKQSAIELPSDPAPATAAAAGAATSPQAAPIAVAADVARLEPAPAVEVDPAPADEQVAAAGFGPPSRAGQLAFAPILEAVRHFPWPGSRPEGEDEEPCLPPAAAPEPAPIAEPQSPAAAPVACVPEAAPRDCAAEPAEASAPPESSAAAQPDAAALPVTTVGPVAEAKSEPVAEPSLEPVVIDSSEIVELVAGPTPIGSTIAASLATAPAAELPDGPSAVLPAPSPPADEPREADAPSPAQAAPELPAAVSVEPRAITPPPLPHATVAAEPPGVQAFEITVGAAAAASPEAGGQPSPTSVATEGEALPPARPEETTTAVSVALVVSSEASRPAAAPAPEPVAPPPPKVEEPKPAPRPLPRMPEIPPNAVFNGELLRRVREGRGLTARELADRTKIGLSHVENIEADRYGPLPTAVYLRGFLMLIARELKLDPLKVSKSYLEQVARDSGKKSG